MTACIRNTFLDLDESFCDLGFYSILFHILPLLWRHHLVRTCFHNVFLNDILNFRFTALTLFQPSTHNLCTASWRGLFKSRVLYGKYGHFVHWACCRKQKAVQFDGKLYKHRFWTLKIKSQCVTSWIYIPVLNNLKIFLLFRLFHGL